MSGAAGEITAGYLDKGLEMKVLSMFHSGFRDFMTINKPLNSIKDFDPNYAAVAALPLMIGCFQPRLLRQCTLRAHQSRKSTLSAL
jgi:TRAP-type C4-dicarboxylate transport system substrate-binding protein